MRQERVVILETWLELARDTPMPQAPLYTVWSRTRFLLLRWEEVHCEAGRALHTETLNWVTLTPDVGPALWAKERLQNVAVSQVVPRLVRVHQTCQRQVRRESVKARRLHQRRRLLLPLDARQKLLRPLEESVGPMVNPQLGLNRWWFAKRTVKVIMGEHPNAVPRRFRS